MAFKVGMRGRCDDRDRLGRTHGRNAAIGGAAGHVQVPPAHVPAGRFGHLEPGQGGGVRKRPRGLQHPQGAADAGAAAVVDVGPAEGSSSSVRLLHGGVPDAAPTAAVQRAWDVRPGGVMAALVLDILGFTRTRIVFIESICRVKTLSISGRLLYGLLWKHRFLVQWPELALKYPRATYIGQLV